MLILVYFNILQESTTYIVTFNINSDMTLPLISHLVYYNYFSFPFFGLLADIKTAGYNTITTGVHFMFLSWVFAGLAVIVKTLFGFHALLHDIMVCCLYYTSHWIL